MNLLIFFSILVSIQHWESFLKSFWQGVTLFQLFRHLSAQNFFFYFDKILTSNGHSLTFCSQLSHNFYTKYRTGPFLKVLLHDLQLILQVLAVVKLKLVLILSVVSVKEKIKEEEEKEEEEK